MLIKKWKPRLFENKARPYGSWRMTKFWIIVQYVKLLLSWYYPKSNANANANDNFSNTKVRVQYNTIQKYCFIFILILSLLSSFLHCTCTYYCINTICTIICTILFYHRLCLRTKRTNKIKIVNTKHTMHFIGLPFFCAFSAFSSCVTPVLVLSTTASML